MKRYELRRALRNKINYHQNEPITAKEWGDMLLVMAEQIFIDYKLNNSTELLTPFDAVYYRTYHWVENSPIKVTENPELTIKMNRIDFSPIEYKFASEKVNIRFSVALNRGILVVWPKSPYEGER